MVFVHVAKLRLRFLGFAIAAYVPLMMAMIVTGAVGNWLGEVALDRTPEKRYRLVLKVFLTGPTIELLAPPDQAGWW